MRWKLGCRIENDFVNAAYHFGRNCEILIYLTWVKSVLLQHFASYVLITIGNNKTYCKYILRQAQRKILLWHIELTELRRYVPSISIKFAMVETYCLKKKVFL
jgi:hypothetical protein